MRNAFALEKKEEKIFRVCVSRTSALFVAFVAGHKKVPGSGCDLIYTKITDRNGRQAQFETAPSEV